MRKITLDPDELAVDSFDTVADAEARGTVDGQQYNWTAELNGYTCSPYTCNPPSCPAFSCASQCPRGCFEEWSERYDPDGLCI